MRIERPTPASPYLIANSPTSPGRALLARAYEHYCVMQWGWSGEQVDDALRGVGDIEAVQTANWSTRLLGELMAAGDVRTWARPIGGGEPFALKPGAWEIDDFVNRFASSALDPARPFDESAPPTHWIFVDLDDWNRIMEASLGQGFEKRSKKADQHAGPAGERSAASSANPAAGTGGPVDERLIRRPEVERRTGLSRATIYRRMDAGTFPRSLSLGGNVTVWRESEIAAWVASPR